MTRSDSIKQLAATGISDRSEFGNKAAMLGTLIRAGIPVPEGWAVSKSLHRALGGPILAAADANTIVVEGGSIRTSIVSAQVDSLWSTALKEVWDRLDKSHGIAIRSSGTAEDSPSRSWAGVYESETGIISFDDAVRAVKACVGSLYADRALEYALEAGCDVRFLSMAVILQRHVEGESSGVAYTTNPLTMDTGQVLVHSVAGPCRLLVDGSKSPAVAVIQKDSGAVRRQGSASDPGALSSRELQILLSALKLIEDAVGPHQDVEYTFSGDDLWILQTRPIATIRQPVPPAAWEPNDGKQWDLVQYRAALPPLKAAAVRARTDGARLGAEKVGFDWCHTQDLFCQGYHYARQEPAPGADERSREWAGHVRVLLSEGRNVFQDVILPDIRARRSDIEARLAQAPTGAELAELLRLALEHARFLGESHWKAVWGCAYAEGGWPHLPSFREEVGEVLGRLSSAELFDLMYVSTSFTIYRLGIAELARVVQSIPSIERLFRGCHYNRVLYARLAALPDAAPFMGPLASFLADYGRSEASGWENPVGPTLTEEPHRFIAMLRPYIGTDLAERLERNASQIQTSKAIIRDRVVQELTAAGKEQFLKRLSLAEKSFAARDDHAMEIDAAYYSCLRLVCDRISRVLLEDGTIAHADEVWLFEPEELTSHLSGRARIVQAVVAKRREEYARALRIQPPRTLNAREVDPGPTPGKTVVPGELRGDPNMRKVTRGTVVKAGSPIAADSQTNVLVMPDERSLDVWPFATRLAAVLIEQGSALSHVGTTAREMGILVLYGVRGATNLLTEGQLVEVDGYEGVARVVDENNGPSRAVLGS